MRITTPLQIGQEELNILSTLALHALRAVPTYDGLAIQKIK